MKITDKKISLYHTVHGRWFKTHTKKLVKNLSQGDGREEDGERGEDFKNLLYTRL